MSNFEFDGNLQGVSELQLDYIGSVLEERGYKNGKVMFEAVGKAGDNYVANVKRIIVEKDGTTFKMIAKIAPRIEELRIMMNTASLFRNEHYMYTEVLPKFAEMLETAKVPESERLRYATCYGTNLEIPNEVILVEDLQLSDYVILDRFKSFTDNTVKLVLKHFSILHSLSYALKRQEPETYEDFKTKIVDVWDKMSSAEAMQMYFGKFEEDVLTILDDDKYTKRVKGSLSHVADVCIENSKIDEAYSVIEHGDAWTNNIMFKLEGDRTVDCCMIDYQVSKNGSPVGDIHYMIFNCTDYETRSKHYHDWIDYYHSELDRSLANFDLKANSVYPRDQLDADLKRFGKMSFSRSLLLASFLILEASEAAVMKDAMERGASMDEIMNETKVTTLTERSISRLKTRIEGLVDSFIELGYIL